MRWNWQQADWPDFTYDDMRLREAEERFLKNAGVVVGAMHHLDGGQQQALAIELISREVVDNSAIEGEVLDRASVQSSLAKHLGLAADRTRANAAEACHQPNADQREFRKNVSFIPFVPLTCRSSHLTNGPKT